MLTARPYLLAFLFLVSRAVQAQAPVIAPTEEQAAQLRKLIADSQRLPLDPKKLMIQAPSSDWTTGYVSSVAADRNGITWVLLATSKSIRYLPSMRMAGYFDPGAEDCIQTRTASASDPTGMSGRWTPGAPLF